MKTLIEKSIEIYGMGHPEVKTIFNIEKEDDRLDIRFRPLTKISGRKLTVFFDYQNGDNKVSDKLQMTIIKSDDENDIKNYILSTINQYLS